LNADAQCADVNIGGRKQALRMCKLAMLETVVFDIFL